jgi:hypothetical protein
MRPSGPGDLARGIQGTFYPTDRSGGPTGSAIPKIVMVAVALLVVRTVVAGKRRHAGGAGPGGRHAAIAEFHRQLHASDESGASPETGATA